jgi:hypothetical protein
MMHQSTLFFRPEIAGRNCNECGQYIKLYRRKIYASVVKRLMGLYKLNKICPDKFFHVNEIYSFVPGKVLNGDFTLGKWFDLIEELKHNDDPTKKTSGRWRITEKGNLFIENKITIPKYVLLYNHEQYGFEGEEVSVLECLGKNFNYSELMTNGM